MIIAIDGPAGSGKSSVAKRVAEETGFEYLNSGNFYRTVTYAVLRDGIDPRDSGSILKKAESLHIELKNGMVHLDSMPVDSVLHTDEIDRWVAQHSAITGVRHIVNRLLKAAADDRNIVVEGRDITTVVFPDAAVRLFIDASVEERARRRFNQGVSSLSLEETIESLKKRDAIDTTKPFGSLKVAEGSIYLDTSLLTIDEVCEKVIHKIREIEPCT